ncbi:MAG: hypothetical protein QXS54_01590 [Candidatus Methanomethylicaceae archaeon]
MPSVAGKTRVGVREARRRLATIAKAPWLFREYRDALVNRGDEFVQPFATRILSLFVPYPGAVRRLDRINRRTGILEHYSTSPTFTLRPLGSSGSRLRFTLFVYPYNRRSTYVPFLKMIWHNILRGNLIFPRHSEYLVYPIEKGLDESGVRLFPSYSVAKEHYKRTFWVHTGMDRYNVFGVRGNKNAEKIELIYRAQRSVRLRSHTGVVKAFREETDRLARRAAGIMMATVRRAISGQGKVRASVSVTGQGLI